jgi:hypothetical protein
MAGYEAAFGFEYSAAECQLDTKWLTSIERYEPAVQIESCC